MSASGVADKQIARLGRDDLLPTDARQQTLGRGQRHRVQVRFGILDHPERFDAGRQASGHVAEHCRQEQQRAEPIGKGRLKAARRRSRGCRAGLAENLSNGAGEPAGRGIDVTGDLRQQLVRGRGTARDARLGIDGCAAQDPVCRLQYLVHQAQARTIRIRGAMPR